MHRRMNLAVFLKDVLAQALGVFFAVLTQAISRQALLGQALERTAQRDGRKAGRCKPG